MLVVKMTGPILVELEWVLDRMVVLEGWIIVELEVGRGLNFRCLRGNWY